MGNNIRTNNAPHAKFATFIASQKSAIPKALADELTAHFEEYERVCKEQLKYVSPMAEAKCRETQERAIKEPTAENIAALEATSLDELRRKYEGIANTLYRAAEQVCERFRPLLPQLRDIFVPIVDGEIVRVKLDGSNTANRYGCKYDASADGVVLSLERWRELAVDWLSGNRALRPDQLVQLIGEVRPKRFFG